MCERTILLSRPRLASYYVCNCNDVEVEPVLQELTGEVLPKGANRALDARLDIHARGFWERQRSAFFDVRVCHPNADSYKDLTPQQIYRQHENEKKRMYGKRVMEVELASNIHTFGVLNNRRNE